MFIAFASCHFFNPRTVFSLQVAPFLVWLKKTLALVWNEGTRMLFAILLNDSFYCDELSVWFFVMLGPQLFVVLQAEAVQLIAGRGFIFMQV